jgi:hypothetical protein
MSNIVSEHPFSLGGLTRRYLPHVWMLVIFAVIGLCLLLMGITRPNAGTVLPGLLMLAIGLAFAVPIFIGYQQRVHWVKLTADGVQWQEGVSAHSTAWTDIRAVRQLEKIINQTFRQRELTLTLADGKEVKFDHRLEDYDLLAETVQQRTADLLYDQYRTELDAGRAAFGPVSLSRDSLSLRQKEFPWSAAQQCRIVRGYFSVALPGKDLDESQIVMLAEVPNYFVLLRLLTEMGKFSPGFAPMDR